jgi:hypothetical protein
MNINIKIFLSTLLSALIVGAAAAASTLAAPDEYVVEGKGLLTPKNIEGTSGLSLIAGTVSGVEVRIECPQDTLTGSAESGGHGKSTVLLKKCVVTKPTGCTTNLTIEAKANSTLLESAGKLYEELIGSGASEELAKIVIEGSGCPAAGSYALDGKQTCELPIGGEVLVEHEVVCKKTSSNLKMAGNTASLSSTEKVKMTTSEKFRFRPPPAFSAIVEPAVFTNAERLGKVTLENTGPEEKITNIKLRVGEHFEIKNQAGCEKNYKEKDKCKFEVKFTAVEEGVYNDKFDIQPEVWPGGIVLSGPLTGEI